MVELIKDLLKLQALDDSLSRQFDANSKLDKKEWRALLHKAHEIVQLKFRIKTEFARSSTFVFDGDNSSSKIILQNINSGKLLFADLVCRSYEEITGNSLDLDSLSWDELEQLASDELYSWFGPTEYIKSLIEIGALILDIDIPPQLKFIVQETRRCYAFEQHIAVYSLCRTFLESAMRDICLRTGDIKPNRNPRAGFLIKRLSKHDYTFNRKINKLYRRLSDIAHGSQLSDSIGVQNTFRETALIVQELYERNRYKISSLEKDTSN